MVKLRMRKEEWSELAELLIPTKVPSLADFARRYPPRQLSPQSWVTRIAPSPTGFPHFGFLYTAFINERLAHQSGGVFLLRIEDTDQKREKPGAKKLIIDILRQFAIPLDEGPEEGGDYGPYIQSQRRQLYLAAAKELIRRGWAYPCFCSPSQLAKLRQEQQAKGVQPGYYGRWARCRHLSLAVIKKKLARGQRFVLRFRAQPEGDKIVVNDLIKGKLTLPVNRLDYVLFKSGPAGLTMPVYHLAAMVDDHFQGISHVLRGEEWLSSLPLHYQIYRAFGWQPPRFGHLAPIMKLDQGKRRKLSKRRDPEADLRHYQREGFPPRALKAYIFRLVDANFDDWRRQHPQAQLTAFRLRLARLSRSRGPLFDLAKLQQLARDEIHLWLKQEPEAVYQALAAWLRRHQPKFWRLFRQDPAYSRRVLMIEKESRKDLSCWRDFPRYFSYFYDELWQPLPLDKWPLAEVPPSQAREILHRVATSFHGRETAAEWTQKLRQLSQKLAYAPRLADYRRQPEKYRGHVGHLAMVLRLAVSGRQQTPDLWAIMRVMGWPRFRHRLEKQAAVLNG